MPLTTTDTFGAVNFSVLSDGRGRNTGSDVSVRHIPGGNVTYIDRGGRHHTVLRLTLYIPDPAELAALEAKANDEDTLTYLEGIATAILENVDSSDYWTDGQQRVTATFHVVAWVP